MSPKTRDSDPAPDGAAALHKVLARLREVEAELDALDDARIERVREAVDHHMVAMEAELGQAQRMVADAGEAADRRLRESVDRIIASHADMKRRYDEAMSKPAGRAREEAKGLFAPIGRAVRDSLLHIGGPIDPPMI